MVPSRSLLIALLLSQQDVLLGLMIPLSSSRAATKNSCQGRTFSQLNTRLSVADVRTATNEIFFESDDDELLDDEDFDIDDIISKKSEWDQELELLAQTASDDPKAVEKAQAIFDKMFEAFIMTDDETLCPNVDVYNLLLETFAYSKSGNGGEEAELILSRMEDETIDYIARPNVKTYLNIMDAWAHRKNPEKAQGILKKLEERFSATQDESLRPTVDAQNKMIKAYGLAGDAEKAESLLRDFLEESGDRKANYNTWLQTMKAYASQRDDGTEKVQGLMNEMLIAYRMGEDDYKPKTEVYNTLIRAMAEKQGGAADAEAMLYDMMSKFQAGDKDMRPNVGTFRNVIRAFRRRSDAGAGVKVEKLLQIQEGMYNAANCDPELKLDVRIFNSVLAVIARSKDPKKASRAKRIVDKMKNGDKTLAPNMRTFYFQLSACAHTDGTADENLASFQIAVDTLNEVRESDNYQPDSGCFGMFVRACGNLMPPSRKRDAVVQNVFRKCCKDGVLNEFVLSEFEKVASEELQLEILGGFLEDGVRLPDEWSRSAV
jgi:pentatricopeptide repeat protein